MYYWWPRCDDLEELKKDKAISYNNNTHILPMTAEDIYKNALTTHLSLLRIHLYVLLSSECRLLGRILTKTSIFKRRFAKIVKRTKWTKKPNMRRYQDGTFRLLFSKFEQINLDIVGIFLSWKELFFHHCRWVHLLAWCIKNSRYDDYYYC